MASRAAGKPSKPAPDNSGTDSARLARARALHRLPMEAIEDVAAYFQVLSGAPRLRLLRILSEGECSVGELAEQSGASVANTSRHLAMLERHGFIVQERHGNTVLCRIDDPTVFDLCEVVCDSIAKRLDELRIHRQAFGPAR